MDNNTSCRRFLPGDVVLHSGSAFRRIFWTVDLDYRVHVAQFPFLKGLSVHVSQETSRRDVSYFFCVLASRNYADEFSCCNVGVRLYGENCISRMSL